MSSDASVLLSAAKWSDCGHHLDEFGKTYGLPQIGKIIKGQYSTVGAPSLSSPSLNQMVLWAAGGKRVNVIAQSVRFKDGRNANNGRSVPFGPKLVIPDNYDGWWEILSEEGKSVRCVDSIADLTKRCADSFLVRDNIKAQIAKTDDSNQVSDKARTVQTGELLTILSVDVVGANTKSNGVRYVRCRSSKGDIIYLNLDQKGKFSPVAKEGISGVHSIGNLLSKRLPLMVRLVCGKPPQGIKNFHSSVRLLTTFEEDCLLAMPLHKDNQTLIQVPISAALKILGPKNANELSELKEFEILSDLSKQLTNNLTDKMRLLDTQIKDLEPDVKVCPKSGNNSIKAKMTIKFIGHYHDHKRRLQSNFLVKRSSSDPQPLNQKFDSKDELKRGSSLDESQTKPGLEAKTEPTNNENNVNDQFYEEIDQIYDYVRGFAPLPQRIKSEFDSNKLSEPLKTSVLNNDNKPEPPPIITIPSIQNRRTCDPISNQKHSLNGKKAKKCMQSKELTKSAKSPKSEEKVMPNVRFAYYGMSANPVSAVSAVSAGPMFVAKSAVPNSHPQALHQSSNGQKLFVKNNSGQRNTWKCNRFLKYAKQVSSPFRAEQQKTGQRPAKPAKEVANQTCRSSRSLSTSPIFNIRYKSMNNLHYITPPALNYSNTIESSNSGHTSSGSGSKELFRDPKSKLPKLSRSLTNVFWDVSCNMMAIDTINKLNNELNDRKNMTCPQLLPVHFNFLNALDTLQLQNQQIQQIQQMKEQTSKGRHLGATLYL